MEVIVLQHIKIEDPGYIKDLMLNDGVNLTTIELDEGEKIPNDLNKFDINSFFDLFFSSASNNASDSSRSSFASS